jgi:hypothetical protein
MKKRTAPPRGGEIEKGGAALSPCQTTSLTTLPPLTTFVVVVENRREEEREEREKKVGRNNREVGGEAGEVVRTQKIAKMVAVNENGQRVGETHPRAKLTDHEVELLLELRGEGFSYGWLAVKFEISKKHAWRICTGVARGQTPARHRRVLAVGGKR